MFHVTGYSNRNRVLVVSMTQPSTSPANTEFVCTPLDMIARLERDSESVSTVVLTGRFATREVVSFLADEYPHVVVISRRPHEDAEQPALAACA